MVSAAAELTGQSSEHQPLKKVRVLTNTLRFLVRHSLHNAFRFFIHLKHTVESNELKNGHLDFLIELPPPYGT